MSSSYTSPRIGTKSFSGRQRFLAGRRPALPRRPHGRGDPGGVCRRERLLRRRRRRHLHARADVVGMVGAGGARGQVAFLRGSRGPNHGVVRGAGPQAALARHGNLLPRPAKLPEPVLRQLVYNVGDGLESRVPADWLWLSRHVKLVDGTTLLTPDTEENQEVWPQHRSQKPGLGFPLLRMVVVLSLATAALCGLAIGLYKGKQTGESALLRGLLDRFQRGNVLLGDSPTVRTACWRCRWPGAWM